MAKTTTMIRKRCRGREGCESWSSFFSKLLLVSSIFTLFLIALAASPVAANAAPIKASHTSGGDDCSVLLLVKADFCYGIILTKSNVSGGEDTVRFTFTYNSSLHVGEKLQLYGYTTNGTLKPPADGMRAQYDSAGFYYISKSGTCVCRLYDRGVETQFGADYVRITVTTQEKTENGEVTWSSGYNVGMGATVKINSGEEGEGVDSEPLDAATTVALTVTSLVPFFMLLPEATKKLCQAAADGTRHGRGDGVGGSRLYVKILAVFTPLLCIGIVMLSVTAMLNTLKPGSA
nr:hypothetical protein [Candidatus Njordarchaeota archaeon]